jgi:hypothetical protein
MCGFDLCSGQLFLQGAIEDTDFILFLSGQILSPTLSVFLGCFLTFSNERRNRCLCFPALPAFSPRLFSGGANRGPSTVSHLDGILEIIALGFLQPWLLDGSGKFVKLSFYTNIMSCQEKSLIFLTHRSRVAPGKCPLNRDEDT